MQPVFDNTPILSNNVISRFGADYFFIVSFQPLFFIYFKGLIFYGFQ
nr:MAG TPA: hypothetical protein [Caudoviricetes sp.]